MMKYFKIYKTLLSLNLKYLMEYRANFINSLISSVIWGSISFLSIVLLTEHTNMVYGWTREELLLLTAVYNIITGLFYVLFSINFQQFSRTVHYGELDSVLLRPVDPQFSMSLWYCNYTSLFRIVVGVLIACIILQGKFTTTPYVIFLFLLLMILGIIIMYSTWYLISTIIIKFTNLSNLSGLLYEINGFARFPQDMYRNLGTFAFTFLVPLTIFITAPTKALIDQFTIFDLWIMSGIAITLFISARISWKFALRFYTSASG